MGDGKTFEIGSKVRHRDVGDDGPVGTISKLFGHTADGEPIYYVTYRSPTGSKNTTRYPMGSLVLVEAPPAQA
ncbi:MAG TPA: hypothetical protein PKE32_01020 [Miltoncostaeaceae bacterium]|nr:hypothetical protein [Miltoncostaeaceae bacterium]